MLLTFTLSTLKMTFNICSILFKIIPKETKNRLKKNTTNGFTFLNHVCQDYLKSVKRLFRPPFLILRNIIARDKNKFICEFYL